MIEIEKLRLTEEEKDQVLSHYSEDEYYGDEIAAAQLAKALWGLYQQANGERHEWVTPDDFHFRLGQALYEAGIPRPKQIS